MRVNAPLMIAMALALFGTRADAQPLGSFSWQLQPYCNVVTVSVVQNGAVYTLDGWDDQCGAPTRAPLVGTATLNPDGSVGLGLHITTTPGAAPLAVDARIDLASLSGQWSDSGGLTGTFVFGATASGPARPAVPRADITEVTAGLGLTGGALSGAAALAVDTAVVQARVTGQCAAGQTLQSIGQDGTVTCQGIPAGGDITAVLAGAGLTGGGVAGDVGLAVDFAGPGAATTSARSDHLHDDRYLQRTDVIVMAVSVGAFGVLAGSGPTSTNVAGPTLASSADGSVSIPFAAPVAVGGTSYTLSSVEYCMTQSPSVPTAYVNAVVVASDALASGIPLSLVVNDPTDRTVSGCYSIAVPATSARSFGLIISLAGSATPNAIYLSGVRTTWVPVP